MPPSKWIEMCSTITDAMNRHTRPFVTPLTTSDDDHVRLVGSGTYVTAHGQRLLLTCEHVARISPMEYRFFGSDSVFRHPEPFTSDPDPTDAAFARITDDAWSRAKHQADAVFYERFAHQHSVATQTEPLFFRGFAGENAYYGFDTHEANASGYCSQQKVVDELDSRIFDIFWEPDNTTLSHTSSAEAQKRMRFDDPGGFSGSLIWNTRYVEVSNAGRQWNPAEAVVTGLLHRYDPKTKTLLALRIEHLRNWLEQYIQPM